MIISKNKLILVLMFALNFACPGYADDTHYINSNVGDRASGMAGAYTAVSDDSSGCYYNPAGIAFAPSNKFSASVNAVSVSTRVYKDVIRNQSGGTQDWEQKSFSLLPNFFGIVQKFGAGMVGFSYAVPDSAQMRQKQTFTNVAGIKAIDAYTIDINNYDKAYLFGPSYSYQVSNSLSFGGTLYYYYRDSERIINEFVQFNDATEAITNVHTTRTDQGLKPILGVIWDPIDNLSLGLTVSKLWILSSNPESQSIANNYGIDAADFSLSNVKLAEDKFPFSTNLGLAWFYSPSLLFSCDLKYFDKINEKKSVLNMAFATEYYTSDHFAIRAGVYTDLSNAPDVTAAAASDNEQIDIYGVTLSGSLFSGKSSVSAGVDWGFGKGDSQVTSSNTVYDVVYNNLTFHISTSFNY